MIHLVTGKRNPINDHLPIKPIHPKISNNSRTYNNLNSSQKSQSEVMEILRIWQTLELH